MRKQIIEILREIEIMENIKVMYACESGSRAWGFDSKDSDHDIRFIYTRPMSSYFSISPLRDVIDRNKGNIMTSAYIRKLEEQEIDVVGFDISKAIKMIADGNPALAEWLHSPIVYIEKLFVTAALQRLSERFFKSKAGIYHYEHMARKNFTQYIKNVDEDVIIKKYLYVLRPLYACEYIIMTNGGVPPMDFNKLIELSIDYVTKGFDTIHGAVKNLVARKKAGEELGRAPHIDLLDDFCSKALKSYSGYAETLGVVKLTEEEYSSLDSAFFDIVCK